MSCYSICSTSPGTPVLDPCEVLSGRIRGLALVRCDVQDTLDATSLSEWNALIAAQTAYLFPETRGDVPAGSFSEVDGYGNTDTRTVSEQITFNFQHNVVRENIPFWNNLNYNYDWFAYLKVENGTEEFHLITPVVVNWQVDPVVGAALTDETNIQGTGKFTTNAGWNTALIPAGLYT